MRNSAAKKFINFAKKYPDELIFIALGGVEEIGMNAYLYHYRGSWVLIDAGIGFADYRMPGIDILLPDLSVFEELPLDAVLITHPHEDHIGALPQLLENRDVPLYMGELTAHLVEQKLTRRSEIHRIVDSEPIAIGALTVIPRRVAHSVPEAFAFYLQTDFGLIVHSGDWKYDSAPMIGNKFKAEDWQLEGKKIKVMICDSTNIMVPGAAGSESLVSKPLQQLMKDCHGSRIFVTCFASNIARMNVIMRAAHKMGRTVVLMGRAMQRMYHAGSQMGWFETCPPPIAEEDIKGIPPQDLLILLTGSQGEGRSMLAKIARGDYKKISIEPGDKIFFSSRTIPGNEIAIGNMQNQIAHQGGELVYASDSQNIHVSGHYQREEIAKTYQLLKPEWVIPVHGEARHLRAHCQFASEMGIKPIYLPGNGRVVVIGKDDVFICGEAEINPCMVEPNGQILSNESKEFFERKRFIWNGALVMALAVGDDDMLQAVPQITALGLTMDEGLREDLAIKAEQAFEEHYNDGLPIEAIIQKLETVIRKYCRITLKKRPVVSISLLYI